MLRKENDRNLKFTVGVLFSLFFLIAFIYRVNLTNSILNLYANYTGVNTGVNNVVNLKMNLNLSERQELEKLRVENSVLRGDMKDLKKEINLIEDGLEPTYVKMLGKNNLVSNFYGSFYVTYPKDKTVYKGMNLYGSGNVLIGQVEEVLQNSLFITRLGQNKTFLAEAQDSKEQIELSSLSGGQYLGNVAAGSKISNGDNIVLKGYPRAVVGIVSEIVKNQNSNSNVFVRAPYNIYDKEIFYVLQ